MKPPEWHSKRDPRPWHERHELLAGILFLAALMLTLMVVGTGVNGLLDVLLDR
jgi:hypothetical protein